MYFKACVKIRGPFLTSGRHPGTNMSFYSYFSLFGDIRTIYGLLANGVSSSQVPGLLFWTSFDLGGR